MKPKVITREEIRRILGPIDEDRIIAILDVGATAAEVEAAKTLADANQPPPGRDPVGRTAIVHRVYDLLRADLPEPERRS